MKAVLIGRDAPQKPPVAFFEAGIDVVVDVRKMDSFDTKAKNTVEVWLYCRDLAVAATIYQYCENFRFDWGENPLAGGDNFSLHALLPLRMTSIVSGAPKKRETRKDLLRRVFAEMELLQL